MLFYWVRDRDPNLLALSIMLASITLIAAFLANGFYPSEFGRRRKLESMSAIPVAATAVYASLFIVVPAEPKGLEWNEMACLSNAKQFTTGLMLYLEDNDGVFPPKAEWQNKLKLYGSFDTRSRCPVSKEKVSYGLNSAIAGTAQKSIADPSSVVVVFECGSDNYNFSGSQVDFKPRHNGLGTVGLADGSAKLFKPTLRWEP
jgi:hypothetical protein